MVFPHQSILEFEYHDARRASAIADSVALEIGEIDDDRSRTTISTDGQTVTVRVNARDLTALRAASNTWSTLVDVAETTYRLGGKPRKGT